MLKIRRMDYSKMLNDEIVNRQSLIKANTIDVEYKWHIFYSFRQNYKNDLDHFDFLHMKYCYNLCEKYIAAYAEKDEETCNIFFEKLNLNIDDEFPTLIKCGMQSIMLAAIALRHYYVEDFNTAITCLKRSVHLSTLQSQQNCNEFLLVVPDVWFNMIRVYGKWNKIDFVIDEVVSLLSFLLFNNHSDLIMRNGFKQIHPKAKVSSINFIRQNLFKVIDTICINNRIAPNDVYKEIISKTFIH